jgi:hypothetical protein
MTESDEKQLVGADIEPVDDTIVTYTEPELRPPLQALMRITF